MKSKKAYEAFLKMMKDHAIDYNGDRGYVETGWHDSLNKCIVDLISLGWDKCVAQIKEKYGTGRFYIDKGSDAILKRINQWEQDTAHICEYCSNPGYLRTRGWWKTMCDNCWGSHTQMFLEE